MRKSIFVYEPYGRGHHIGFLRILLAEFAGRGGWHTTLLTTEEAKGHASFSQIGAEFDGSLEVLVAQPVRISPFVSRLANDYYADQFANFGSLRREFRALSQTRRFDFALLPYMEAVGIHNLALRSPFEGTPWGTIAFGLKFHFREAGIKAPLRRTDWLQRLCFRRVLKYPDLVAAFSLDPYAVSCANHPKAIYVPDPSTLPPPLVQTTCRRALKLPEDAPIVLVYGAIDRRKCIDLLLQAVAKIDPKWKVTIVIAGIQHDRWLQRTVLQGQAAARLRGESRLIEIDRFITDDEERLLFASADVVWAYYSNSFGSSGALVKAGQHARPVIANDAGLVGKIVSDERCGLAVSNPDPAPVAGAITRLVTQPAHAKEMGRRGFARFSGHTPEAFAGPIAGAIEAANRVARDPWSG